MATNDVAGGRVYYV